MVLCVCPRRLRNTGFESYHPYLTTKRAEALTSYEILSKRPLGDIRTSPGFRNSNHAFNLQQVCCIGIVSVLCAPFTQSRSQEEYPHLPTSFVHIVTFCW